MCYIWSRHRNVTISVLFVVLPSKSGYSRRFLTKLKATNVSCHMNPENTLDNFNLDYVEKTDLYLDDEVLAAVKPQSYLLQIDSSIH